MTPPVVRQMTPPAERQITPPVVRQMTPPVVRQMTPPVVRQMTPPLYTLEILKKKTIEQLKTIIEDEIDASVPVSKIQRVSKKEGLIKYILNPTEETLQEVTGTRRNRPNGGKFTRRR